jgi:hypothetical protein
MPLDKELTRRRDLYLKRHNIKKRQTSLLQEGFELAVTNRKRKQTEALDGASIGIG